MRSRGDAGEFPGVDLDMLASDIADMLDRYEYPVDAASTDIRPALPAFLRAITASAAAGEAAAAEHDPDARLPGPLPCRAGTHATPREELMAPTGRRDRFAAAGDFVKAGLARAGNPAGADVGGRPAQDDGLAERRPDRRPGPASG